MSCDLNRSDIYTCVCIDRQVQDVRALYEKKLSTTTKLYDELTLCMEQLESKQRELDT